MHDTQLPTRLYAHTTDMQLCCWHVTASGEAPHAARYVQPGLVCARSCLGSCKRCWPHCSASPAPGDNPCQQTRCCMLLRAWHASVLLRALMLALAASTSLPPSGDQHAMGIIYSCRTSTPYAAASIACMCHGIDGAWCFATGLHDVGTLEMFTARAIAAV